MSKDIMHRAVNEVINENKSIRSVAEAYGIKSPMTLCRYVKKAREQGLETFCLFPTKYLCKLGQNTFTGSEDKAPIHISNSSKCMHVSTH